MPPARGASRRPASGRNWNRGSANGWRPRRAIHRVRRCRPRTSGSLAPGLKHCRPGRARRAASGHKRGEAVRWRQTMAETDQLLAWRDRFPILQSSVYLVNNSLGAMPASVRDGLGAYADRWAEEGVVAWNDWLPLVRETGDLLGSLFGAPPGSVMMHQNVSTLVSIVASCFEYDGPRRKIVYSDTEFH